MERRIFNLDDPDGFNFYFHDLRKENNNHLVRRQHGGGSVMIWGALTSKGLLDLVVLNGIQRSTNYLKLLKEQN